ncbi:MAG: hypothetical protein JSV79_04110, partial [Armatimonadota bacterium]
MKDGLSPTRHVTSPMRGPLVVVIGLLLFTLAARGAFANTPPIADAGPDQTVCLGEPVMLMGWADDADGDPIVCWDWAVDSAPEGSLADLPDFVLSDPLFLPDLPGDYLLSLVVTDGTNCSLPDTVAIYVAEDPPQSDAATMEALGASDSTEADPLPGPVVGWGLNDFCQATHPGDATDSIAIAAGAYHSLALQSDGTAVGWGWNGSDQASPPSGLADVIAIAAGYGHSLALRYDGTAVAWGDNDYGQCDIPADAQSGIIAIAARAYHSLA